MRNMISKYCCNHECPFDDCDKHIKWTKVNNGLYVLCDFDATCRRYISWLVSEVKKYENV